MLLCFGILALLRQEMPETTLKRIVERLETAKTIRVKFSCEISLPPELPGPIRSAKGELLLQDGNKVRLSIDQDPIEVPPKPLLCVSDGLKTMDARGFSRSKDPAKSLHDCFRGFLPHLGILSGRIALDLPQAAEGEPHFAKGFAPLNVKSGEAEDGTKVLTYNVDGTLIKLWYDPKDLRILKRQLIFDKGSLLKDLTEIYESFDLNLGLPKDAFQLPARR